MCSINLMYGINKNLSKEDKQIFFNLFAYNECRGFDAIGLSYAIKDKTFIFKNKGNINDNLEKLNHHLSKENIRFMFFHNRAKTQGCFNNNANNHPFENSRFIWLHNGIISNDKDLKKEYGLRYKEETDSAIIGYLLLNKLKDKKQNNINDPLKSVLEELKGSFTFILYDKLKDKIYIIKKDNPLFLGYIKELNLILFSSTKEGLTNSIIEQKVYLNYIKDNIYKYTMIVQEIKNNIVLSIEDNNIKEEFDFKPLKEDYHVYFANEKSCYDYLSHNKQENDKYYLDDLSKNKAKRFVKRINSQIGYLNHDYNAVYSFVDNVKDKWVIGFDKKIYEFLCQILNQEVEFFEHKGSFYLTNEYDIRVFLDILKDNIQYFKRGSTC